MTVMRGDKGMNAYISYVYAESVLMYDQSLLCTLTQKLVGCLSGGVDRSPLLCGNGGKSQGMVAVGMGYKYSIYLFHRAARADKGITYSLTGSSYIYKKAGPARPYIDRITLGAGKKGIDLKVIAHGYTLIAPSRRTIRI